MNAIKQGEQQQKNENKKKIPEYRTEQHQ